MIGVYLKTLPNMDKTITLEMVVDTILNEGIIAGLELEKLRKIQEHEQAIKELKS